MPDGREHKLEHRGHPARTQRTARSFQNVLEANTLAIEQSHQNQILETCLGKYLSIHHGRLEKHNKRCEAWEGSMGTGRRGKEMQKGQGEGKGEGEAMAFPKTSSSLLSIRQERQAVASSLAGGNQYLCGKGIDITGMRIYFWTEEIWQI